MLINLTLLSTAIFIFIPILIDGYWTMIVITSIVFFSCDILRPIIGGISFDINIDLPYAFATVVIVIVFIILSTKLKETHSS